MEKEKIVIELCGGRMPEKAHDADAAYDVFTKEDVKVLDWDRYAIPLGFKIQLPKHLAAVIQPRSGMSAKGIPSKKMWNGEIIKEKRIDADVELGLIDSGYTGEVKAIVKTLGIGAFTSGDIFIPAGTKDCTDAHCGDTKHGTCEWCHQKRRKWRQEAWRQRF